MTDPVAEARDEGLRHAFALDGKGGGRALLWSDLEHHEPGDPPVWIDLLFDREPAKAWILRQKGIPQVAREAMVESQSRPGMVEYDDGFLLIIRGVNLNEGARPEDMISLRIWVDRYRVITCRRRILQSVRSVAKSLEDGHGPERPGAVISDVIGEIAQRINLVDQQLNQTLTGIEFEDQVATAAGSESAMSALRRRAAVLRRYLAPQKEAMFRLQQYRGELLDSQDRMEIQAHADIMVQCLEDIDLVREQVIALQDELFNRLAMAQNARMYVLSIVAAIFLPMTFLTGLLGMNVGGIPLATSPVGFTAIAGLSIAMAAGLWWLFKSTRWL